MLVGLPGAGKTASAAKLCARARMAGREATIITMDTVKSGGLAQVQAFAQAMQARLEPAPDLDTLTTAVANSAGKTFTVIDTVGANPFDDIAMNRLMATARAIGAALTFVLAAGGDATDSAEAAIAFREIGATRLVGTRLDTARRFGGLLSAAQAGRLALAAVSTSPEISDGLSDVNPVSLARLLAPQDAAAWCNEPVGESA
jgi:flagellar biosynthesis protein FlhF